MQISKKGGNIPDMLLRWRVDIGDTKRRGGCRTITQAQLLRTERNTGRRREKFGTRQGLLAFFHFASEVPQEG